MSRIVINEGRCKGCLLCTTVCPVSMLRQSSRLNPKGYKVVETDPDKAPDCTGCASCARMCPDQVIVVYRTRSDKGQDKEGS